MQATSFRRQALALVVLLAACGRADRAPAADSSRAAPPATARAVVSAARRGRSYPGALTKPIDAYSGDELYELTRGLRFAGSHERQRGCRRARGCEGTAPTQRTVVQVSAVAAQDSVNAGDLPQYGVVHVRAINRGDAEEMRYGMRPGKSLRYYLIVQHDTANSLRWRLEELETTPPRRHAQIASGRIQACPGHTWTAGVRADFRTCADVDRGDTVVTLPLALRAAVDAPLWWDCDMGCCFAAAQ